ncbi:MAG: SelL-related redox protein [Saprospiraceae bacterium]
MIAPLINNEVLARMQTNKGETVHQISYEKPVFLVFLRHFGCVFCKEALSDLSHMLDNIRNRNIRLVLVHMAEDQTLAEKYFAQYKLKNVSHVSDPNMKYYQEFGLSKGSFSQLFGLKTWMRGFSDKVKPHKLELSKQLGDATQMPGIFTIYKSEIISSYIHRRASDLPDYEALLERAMERVR